MRLQKLTMLRPETTAAVANLYPLPMNLAKVDSGLGLIVGLGNPGAKYAKTRHNAGFWWLDRCADKLALSFRANSKFHGDIADYRQQHQLIHCLKPGTYMNHSGRAVAAIMQYYAIPAQRVLIVHDELDLPVGTVRLKSGGGHGGHNGLRDISSAVGREFWRLRIGIGHPGHKDQVLDYVLKKPSATDANGIYQAIDLTLDVIEQLLAGEMEMAMHFLHSRT